MVFGLSLLIFAGGYLLLDVLIPQRSTAMRMLKFSAGPIMGVGVSTAILFPCMVLADGLSEISFGLYIVFMLVGLAGLFVLGKKPQVADEPERTESNKVIILGLSVLLLLVTVRSVFEWSQTIQHYPHGDWDAKMIWSCRARFLAETTHNLPAVFNLEELSHTDYPLLVPLSIAQFWYLLGSNDVMVPQIIAALFSISVPLIVISGIAALRSWSLGLIAGLLILANPDWVTQTCAQMADIPLTWFFTAATLLLAIANSRDKSTLYLLCGLTAGLAAWTKNEGIIFALAITIAVAVSVLLKDQKTAFRKLIHFLGGMIPVMLVVFLFKLGYAPRNDLIAGQASQSTWALLTDLSRHELIVTKASEAFVAQLLIPLLIGLGLMMSLGVNRQFGRSVTIIGALCLVQASAYYFAYLLSPHDLDWHLRTSIDRLALHLAPLLVIAMALTINSPEVAMKDRKGLLGRFAH